MVGTDVNITDGCIVVASTATRATSGIGLCSAHEEEVLADSQRVTVTATRLCAQSLAIYGRIGETLARSRNNRQVGVFRRALQKRLTQFAGHRAARDSG